MMTHARPHKIGVFDYESLVECLRVNFEQAFTGESFRDPQDAIQRMAAQIMEDRRAMVLSQVAALKFAENVREICTKFLTTVD